MRNVEEYQVPIAIANGKELPMAKDYIRSVTAMKFWRASYEGGPWYKDAKDAQGEDVFIAHEAESDQGKKRRKRSSTYKNYCRSVVDRFTNLVHGSGKVVREGSDVYDAWTYDVDLYGQTLPGLMRRAQQRAAIDGVRYVVMDSTELDPTATVLDARASGARLYVADVDAMKVVNWQYVGDTLVSVLIKQDKKTARLYDQHNVTLIALNNAGRVIEAAVMPHGFGMLPVVPVRVNERGESMLVDIAEVNKSLFNLDSIHKEELTRQTFTSWLLTGVDAEDITVALAGGRRVHCISKAGDIGVNKLSADISQASSLRESISAEISEIWRLAGLSNPEVIQNTESGRALKIRFDEIAATARSIADEGEKAEGTLTELWRRGMGTDDVEDPQYPEDFTSEDVVVDIDNLVKLKSVAPNTLSRLIIRKIANVMFPNMDEEDMKLLEEELEEDVEEKVAPVVNEMNRDQE